MSCAMTATQSGYRNSTAPPKYPTESKQAGNQFTDALPHKNCVMVSMSSTSSHAVRALHSIVFGVAVEGTQILLAES